MMSQGEIQQLHRKGDLALTEGEYMAVIECKTAVLFQGACRTGALVADRNASDPKALADYGYNLGLAFQMDDFKTLIDMLQAYNGIRYTRETAAKYVARAKACLAGFSLSATRDTLCDIADYALTRRG